MKKTWKKIISVLLVIAMVTGGIFLPERNVYAELSLGSDEDKKEDTSVPVSKGVAAYCAGGYRIYLASKHILNEDTHTISASHTYLSKFSSYAYYWFPEKDVYGSTIPVNALPHINSNKNSLQYIKYGMIEQGDIGTFSEITGNTQGFSTWFEATGGVYKNDTASQFKDAMNNTFAGEGKQDNIKNFLDKYREKLITSGRATETDISKWFPKSLDDFYANWFIVVEPVFITYTKSGSVKNYTVFSAQEFFSKNSALGEELTGLSDRADITKIARLMLSASFVNNTTAKGNVYCTYDKEDGTYSKAQAEVDAVEKSIKNVDFPNAGFGLYGGIFSPDRKAGQPSNIGMTVTYDINGSRIGSSVTTEGNITQEEREV